MEQPDEVVIGYYQIVKKGLHHNVMMTFVGQKTLIGCYTVLVQISEAVKMLPGSLQNYSEGHQSATGLDAAALGTVEGLENELGLM